MASVTALGAMSGTSGDGLDLALVNFTETEQGFSFDILKAETIDNDPCLAQEVEEAHTFSGERLLKLHSRYGNWMGTKINEFLGDVINQPLLAGIHGPTIFHSPGDGLSFQLGHGGMVAQASGLPCVSDFRMSDIATGGQGAPLVPIGDELLFGEYDACLNLGGIANISIRTGNGTREAFDICPCNLLLNSIARLAGLNYDDGGMLARRGNVNQVLLWQFSQWPHYQNRPRPSLHKPEIEEYFDKKIEESGLSTEDKMATAAAHIASQIDACTAQGMRVLVTGGGAWNKHLISQMRRADYQIPKAEIVDFKEAVVFALLGLLRWQGRANVLKSSAPLPVAGAVYLPSKI